MSDASIEVGIIIRTVTTEAHNRIEKVKESHSIISTIYWKLYMGVRHI